MQIVPTSKISVLKFSIITVIVPLSSNLYLLCVPLKLTSNNNLCMKCCIKIKKAKCRYLKYLPRENMLLIIK